MSKRRKKERFRGSKTHGWGSKKRHRGKGSRGGRGMAGTGKRAKTLKPTILKLFGNSYFGKHGFKLPKKIRIIQKPINISYIEEHFNDLLSQNIITKENEFYIVDFEKMGYNKLLSNGKPSRKYKIIARFASKQAEEKIKSANGEIIKK